jgi:hypothetical protein
MKNIIVTLTIAMAATMVTASAYAGPATKVPEPVSMSLLAGGIVAIATIRHMRRK